MLLIPMPEVTSSDHTDENAWLTEILGTISLNVEPRSMPIVPLPSAFMLHENGNKLSMTPVMNGIGLMSFFCKAMGAFLIDLSGLPACAQTAPRNHRAATQRGLYVDDPLVF